MNWIPVNFDHVHYSKPHGVPYFWDPKYPEWIQIVEESTWVSKHISWVEPYVLSATHLVLAESG